MDFRDYRARKEKGVGLQLLGQRVFLVTPVDQVCQAPREGMVQQVRRVTKEMQDYRVLALLAQLVCQAILVKMDYQVGLGRQG